MGACYTPATLRIFSRSTLRDFWNDHADAEDALRLWFSIAEKASWTAPKDIKAVFGSADFLPGDRVVFNIRGNNDRLIVQVKYAPLFLIYIRFVGTHAEYSKVDAETI